MGSDPPVGVLVMAYGTASGPDDIERYYTDIRGGRTPSPEHLAELRGRYEAIGNVFPLLDTTRAQAHGLVDRLNTVGPDTYKAYLGMKHSEPFIPEAVEGMAADGVTRAIGIVMAPHWSGMSVETYIQRVRDAIDARGLDLQMTFVRSFHEHPLFISWLSERLRQTLGTLDDGAPARPTVLFTAHSLPERALVDDPYPEQLHESAAAVAKVVGLDHRDGWSIAWQSAGRTPEPWRGPDVLEVIHDLAAAGEAGGVLVCPHGFVSDHLEVVYDLDIEAAAVATEVGLAFGRTRVLNDDPAVLGQLADRVLAIAS